MGTHLTCPADGTTAIRCLGGRFSRSISLSGVCHCLSGLDSRRRRVMRSVDIHRATGLFNNGVNILFCSIAALCFRTSCRSSLHGANFSGRKHRDGPRVVLNLLIDLNNCPLTCYVRRNGGCRNRAVLPAVGRFMDGCNLRGFIIITSSNLVGGTGVTRLRTRNCGCVVNTGVGGRDRRIGG